MGYSRVIDPATSVYFAPELSETGVNCKSDIWSYGLLLYYLLFGIHPIKYMENGKSMNNYRDMYGQGLFKYPEPTSESSCYQGLFSIMTMCLNIDPAQRPDANEILSHSIFALKN